MSPDRWRPPPTPALPQLTSLLLDSHYRLPDDVDVRLHCLSLFVAFLVHSAPSLRYLRLSFEEDEFAFNDWWDSCKQCLSPLGALTQLRGFHFDSSLLLSSGWSRYWDGGQGHQQGPRVQRSTARHGSSLWHAEAWPEARANWRWEREEVDGMREGAREEEEVLAALERYEWFWPMPKFKKEVDGLPGARAFFAALISN